MKLSNYIIKGVLIASLCFTTHSCDFLDIVPVEQATMDDATLTPNSTLGFLYSCYAGIENPVDYYTAEASADEFATPGEWDTMGYSAYKFAYGEMNPGYYIWTDGYSPQNKWNRCYRFINQTHLFLEGLENASLDDDTKAEYRAEAYFLIAYYHFQILRLYGPCPIVEQVYPTNTDENEYPGRKHYDYVTNWITKILDEKVLAENALPPTRTDTEIGRVTSTVAKALKSQVLLYAASPLWNGSFPYSSWKNEKNGKIIETEGYGAELVSKSYDREKWVRAEAACQEALDAALTAGHYLYGTREGDTQLQESEQIPLPYVPGREEESEENTTFKKKVITMRYLLTAKGNQGNKEFIWQLNKNNSFVTACIPNRVVKYNNNNDEWYSGWSGVSPYLNTIERFYTSDGILPEVAANKGDFKPKAEWLKRAGLGGNRSDIINLCVDREPRFYAWMVFDNGDYSSKFVNGEPLLVQLKDGNKQGYNPSLFNRNHSVTGFLTQKFLSPNHVQNTTSHVGLPSVSRPMIRIAELYLNLAECKAMLSTDGKTDSYATKALELLNLVHERAGLRALTINDLTGTTVMDWIKKERYIEFWAEGLRFYDIRRWMDCEDYLAAGKREGLNAEAKVNPTFEEFNQRIVITNQPYKWHNRQYLAPIYYDEVDRNPNLVQAPRY